MSEPVSASHTVKINLPGGIVSTGDLIEIIESAAKCTAGNLRIGNRQQLFMTIQGTGLPVIEKELITAGIGYEIDEDHCPNILSSYICAELFPATNWLSEGVFKDVLTLFDFSPKLKVNLSDARQCLIPQLNGHLNYIGSPANNYWHLYIRFPGTNNLYFWPALIYTDDIAALSEQIEKQLLPENGIHPGTGMPDGPALFSQFNPILSGNGQSTPLPPSFPPFNLPDYEGFHAYKNKLWLGIYSRSELFSLELLQDICQLALTSKLAQLYTTPWKSFIIKGIEPLERAAWENLLRKHSINTGHSLNELNWQTDDLSAIGLELKNYLVKAIDDADISTMGLTFAIKTRKGSGLFGAVSIRKTPSRNLYTLEYSENFDPKSSARILIPGVMNKATLAAELIKLCRYYTHSMLAAIPDLKGPEPPEPAEWIPASSGKQFQCIDCLTVYDEDSGDPENQILPGTPFSELDGYTCSLCGGPSTNFARSVHSPVKTEAEKTTHQ